MSGLLPADHLTGACARGSQVQEATDLNVDVLFVDVYDVLPELYQAVEVVFMGSSMDRITSSGERWEAESVLLPPALLSVPSFAARSSVAAWLLPTKAPLYLTLLGSFVYTSVESPPVQPDSG